MLALQKLSVNEYLRTQLRILAQLFQRWPEETRMPRKARNRVVIPGHPHHIILRGNNRRRIFSYGTEYRFFLSRLRRASERHSLPVHSAMQMSNHVHLVVTPDGHQQLASFIKSTAQPYAQFRNARRGSTGKLFEERFKCIPITSDEQMAVTTVYIELNPVRAGVCETADAYRWSTYRIHAGLGGGDPVLRALWSPSYWFRSLAREPSHRAEVYREWFEHYRARDEWHEVATDPVLQKDRRRFERPSGRPVL